MTARNASFDINPGWGSHRAMLEAALRKLKPGDLVIEHGCGVYSSPLIASFDVRVIVVEESRGWGDWACWLYSTAGRVVDVVSRAKQAVPEMANAALVFVDGAARERADMLRWVLAAGVPTVIAHDTEDAQYGYRLDAVGYEVSHTTEMPRTTMWRRL